MVVCTMISRLYVGVITVIRGFVNLSFSAALVEILVPGTDFALDDITFRECVQQPPLTAASKRPLDKKEPIPINPSKKPVVRKGQTAIPKPVEKKIIAPPVEKQPRVVETVKRQKDTASYSRPKPQVFPAPPTILRTRENTVVKRIEAEPGEITINLYDNGEIDGDTVSIYHNNVLLMAHARLSQKPVSIRIAMDEAHPYHEIVMVAENLGSIPPNTSLMVVTAGATRQEVFISSNEQRNAKVVLRLKE